MHPQLTESLYLKDEVIAMLITSILELRPVSECLFWFRELSTTTDLVDGVWVIYMLFFSTRDHSLECYVRSKIAEYKQSGDLSPLLSIITNLRGSDPDPYPYIIHYYLTNADSFPPSLIMPVSETEPNDFDIYVKPLYRALETGGPKLTGYYLKVATKRLGFSQVRNWLINNSKWNCTYDFGDVFPGDDTCVMAALCARFIRQKSFPRSKFFVPLSNSIYEELTERYKYKRLEPLPDRLKRTRMHSVNGVLAPGNYLRENPGYIDILVSEGNLDANTRELITKLHDLDKPRVAGTPESYLMTMGENRLCADLESVRLTT